MTRHSGPYGLSGNAAQSSTPRSDRFQWKRDVRWYRPLYWFGYRWRLYVDDNFYDGDLRRTVGQWRTDKQHARAQLERQFDPDFYFTGEAKDSAGTEQGPSRHRFVW